LRTRIAFTPENEKNPPELDSGGFDWERLLFENR
jgi:hypothetical protein